MANAADAYRAARFFKMLAYKLPKYAAKQAELFARTVRADVASRYLSFASGPNAVGGASGIALTIATRGKAYGRGSGRPARRPLTPMSIMQRIGQNIILTTKGSPGRGLTFRIQIDPRAKHPHASLKFKAGVPLWLIAYQQESRKAMASPVTHRMRAYLIMMREERGGYGTLKRSARPPIKNFMTGGTVVIIPPHRPVWSWVIQSKLPKLYPLFVKGVVQDIVTLAQKFGGRTISSSGRPW